MGGKSLSTLENFKYRQINVNSYLLTCHRSWHYQLLKNICILLHFFYM